MDAVSFRLQSSGAGTGRHQLVEGFDESLLQLSKAVKSAACCKRVRDVGKRIPWGNEW